jgi:hypothetical protein
VFEDKALADEAVAAVEKQVHDAHGEGEKSVTTVVERVA